jgi:hypothetical protein
MSKKVTTRQFQHGFSSLEKGLRPGESLTVMRHGEPVGTFIKRAGVAKVKLPDFEKDACRPGYGVKVGDAALARLLNDEAIS